MVKSDVVARRRRVERKDHLPMTTLALAESRFRQFLALTKPRVVSLIVFCAVIGMFLAVPGLPPRGSPCSSRTLGIALVAGAAAAINCLVEQKIDALMARTRRRPLPRGRAHVAHDAGLRSARRRRRAVRCSTDSSIR